MRVYNRQDTEEDEFDRMFSSMANKVTCWFIFVGWFAVMVCIGLFWLAYKVLQFYGVV